jgi:hypothetical protein
MCIYALANSGQFPNANNDRETSEVKSTKVNLNALTLSRSPLHSLQQSESGHPSTGTLFLERRRDQRETIGVE